MNKNTKAILFSLIVFLVVFLSCQFIFRSFFDSWEIGVIDVLSAIVAAVLSPRRVVVRQQTGKEIYLKWIFSKSIIRFK